jgi:DNA gyrase subunit A
MKLAKGDAVISLSLVRHAEVGVEERDDYLRAAAAERRGDGDAEVPTKATDLTPQRQAELAANEEFILSITENGYGKRTSAYEYRIANRGGQGIINIETSQRNGEVIAAFPVVESDELLLVTDGGQLIRCPVNDIRIAGRNTQGVTLFSTAEDERVVSVARLSDDGGEGDDGEDDDVVGEAGEGDENQGGDGDDVAAGADDDQQTTATDA